ncbi:MAG TPA: hypothetical protein VIJ22_07085 [Polyangiaceae bacterium]
MPHAPRDTVARCAGLRGNLVLLTSVALLAFAMGATLLGLACGGSTTSIASPIVGEWRDVGDGGTSLSVFLNSDGTCGVIESQGQTSTCSSNCRYTYSDGLLTLTQELDGRSGHPR